MRNAGFFKQAPALAAAQGSITVHIDGSACHVLPGISAAAALLAHNITIFRTTPVSAAPRAPYCMMGVCFDCLLEIDGVPNTQSCLTIVRPGMVIKTQHGGPSLTAIMQDAAS